jgi:hypothetical protein
MQGLGEATRDVLHTQLLIKGVMVVMRWEELYIIRCAERKRWEREDVIIEKEAESHEGARGHVKNVDFWWIPRWQLEGGSRKRASYSEILERQRRHIFAGIITEKRHNFDPSTPPAGAENLHFTLNGETMRAPGRQSLAPRRLGKTWTR